MSVFFISYTKPDQPWAEWIGWTLEDAGHSVIMQAWDFSGGRNFAVEMHRAAAKSDHTIAVLSPDYLKSGFGTAEWAAAFSDDPDGSKRRLIPVRVRECDLTGLLKAPIYIDLVGLTEAEARQRLLDGVSGRRMKPVTKPTFPAEPVPDNGRSPHFPGRVAESKSNVAPARHMPRLRRNFSDLEKRRFVQSAFETIHHGFEANLSALAGSEPRVNHDVRLSGSPPDRFEAEIFVDGESKARCQVWIDRSFGTDSIAFYEGRSFGSGAMNESLSIADDAYELRLRALMSSVAFGRATEGFDTNKLTPQEAAEYLWRRFVTHL